MTDDDWEFFDFETDHEYEKHPDENISVLGELFVMFVMHIGSVLLAACGLWFVYLAWQMGSGR